MTQINAIILALQKLGGRAHLQQIYPLAMEIGDFSGSKKPENTIRNYLLTNPKYFRHSPDKPNGWWELSSFQEEIAIRDKRIKELEEENKKLKSVESADSFVERLVEATKNMFAAKHNDARAVQQILLVLQRMKEQQELMEWIVSKPSMGNKKNATKKVVQNISNSQVFNGSITDSEFNGGGTNNE